MHHTPTLFTKRKIHESKNIDDNTKEILNDIMTHIDEIYERLNV